MTIAVGDNGGAGRESESRSDRSKSLESDWMLLILKASLLSSGR